VSAPWYVEFFQSGDYARLYSFDPERSDRESLHGLKAACADMRSLPFRSASFDGAYSLFSSFG
jgi:hypothetical protein